LEHPGLMGLQPLTGFQVEPVHSIFDLSDISFFFMWNEVSSRNSQCCFSLRLIPKQGCVKIHEPGAGRM
jgi:hypothetical protein